MIKKILGNLTWREIIFYGVMLFICLFIAYQLPYTFDDWDWGLDRIGLVHFLTADVNSRYVGNFFEIIMTRSRIVKTFVMGAVSFLIPIMISAIVSKINKSQNNRMLLTAIAFALVVSIEFKVLVQTYIWVAGFSNYVISFLFLLFYIYFFISEKEYNLLQCVLIGTLACGLQMFLENLTLCMLLLSFIGAIAYRKRKYVFMLIGSAVGTFIMFNNTIYSELFFTGQTADGIRQISFDINQSLKVIIVCAVSAYSHMFAFVIGSANIICALICVLLSIKTWTDLKAKGCEKAALIIVQLGTAVALIFCKSFSTLVYAAGAFLFVAMISCGLIFDSARNKILLFMIISSEVLLIPLSVIGHIERNYFTSDMLLLVVACILAEDVLHKIDLSKFFKNKVFIIATMLICITYLPALIIYGDIGKTDRARYSIIANTDFSNTEQVFLPEFKYKSYIWCCTPEADSTKQFFKEFYGIPEDVKVYIGDTNEGF